MAILMSNRINHVCLEQQQEKEEAAQAKTEAFHSFSKRAQVEKSE